MGELIASVLGETAGGAAGGAAATQGQAGAAAPTGGGLTLGAGTATGSSAQAAQAPPAPETQAGGFSVNQLLQSSNDRLDKVGLAPIQSAGVPQFNFNDNQRATDQKFLMDLLQF